MKISKIANEMPQSATTERTLPCVTFRQARGVLIARRISRRRPLRQTSIRVETS